MSMSVIENSFQVIPPQQPSTQHKGVNLHESIIKSFNLNESQVHKSKLNNNSLPVISTDMLGTFNPQAFHSPPQPTASFGPTMFQRNLSPLVRPMSQNSKVKVNFSYGFGSIQNRIMTPQNTFSQGINRNVPGFGMNVISRRANNFFGDQTRCSSLQNNRPFSNLSELSKSKKAYPEVSSLHNNQLKQFMNQSEINNKNEEVKTHKLGKKFRNVKFSHNLAQRSQYEGNSVNLMARNEFHEKYENTSKNNISMLSMQRSEYVFLPQDHGQIIEIAPQSYVYSQNVIMSRPIKIQAQNVIMSRPIKVQAGQQNINKQMGSTDQSLVFPVQQKEDLSEINIRENQEHYAPSRKSPKKIDNKVYLQESEGLKTIQGKGSRFTELDNINKLSRISVKGNTQHEGFIQPHDILSKQDLNQLAEDKKENLQSNQMASILQKISEHPNNSLKYKENQSQKHKLLQKISDLQQRLHQKEQQNINLLKKLQNKEIQKKINAQYEKVELMSRLNEIEIKKLKNEIKMLQIREKFYLNSEKQKNDQIKHLKTQLQSLKKNPLYHLPQTFTLNKHK